MNTFIRCDAMHPKLALTSCQLEQGHEGKHGSFMRTPPWEPKTGIEYWDRNHLDPYEIEELP